MVGLVDHGRLPMALFGGKTEEEKQREAAEKAAAEYARSPIGLATTAHERGDGFFQLELDITDVGGKSSLGTSTAKVRSTGGRPDLLGQIEDIGWHLEHVGHVYVETGSTSTRRMMSSGEGVVTQGVVKGIYLFRRT
jgi:hypothetical protein